MSQNSDAAADANRESEEGYGDWSDDDFVEDVDDDSFEGVDDDFLSSNRIFLTDMADALRARGLDVEEVDGWKSRTSRIGGYRRRPIGIVLHHTASPASWDGRKDIDFMTFKHKYAPLANLYLDRAGRWHALAAGRANTNGKGGPWQSIPANQANHNAIGIEAGNSGIGEPWPIGMQDAYVQGVAALADHYGVDTASVLAHHEWTSRKIDPAGPSRFGSVNHVDSWDMHEFRTAVDVARGGSGQVQVIESGAATSDGDVYVVRPGDAWWSIADKTMGNPKANWQVLADANGGPNRVLLTGAVLQIPRVAGAATGASVAPGTLPAFPGEASRGMKGTVVRAWQDALIARGAIADTVGNRDADYGPGMERKVFELQQSWGWSNADGIAGPGTWKRLHTGN